MSQLTGIQPDQIIADLEGVIFQNLEKANDGYDNLETADEYLSGNVREKLKTARQYAQLYPDMYSSNVVALEAVQPKDLDASEIDVRLGATWIPERDIKDFILELLVEQIILFSKYIIVVI